MQWNQQFNVWVSWHYRNKISSNCQTTENVRNGPYGLFTISASLNYSGNQDFVFLSQKTNKVTGTVSEMVSNEIE